MPIVRITAEAPVQWTLNNIGPPREYDPGELYEVPDFVARGMFMRGWAREATPDELHSHEQPTELPSLSEIKESGNVNAPDKS